jgi:hypothetical protein
VFPRKETADGYGGTPHDDDELTPEEEAALTETLDRVSEEKRLALLDPGPSWREWFFHSYAKLCVGLAYLVVDAFIFGTWLSDGSFPQSHIVGAIVSLFAATYAEVLLWQYLWRVPAEGTPILGSRFRPNWKALREFGRWTPEWAAIRARPYAPTDGGPDPHEFL